MAGQVTWADDLLAALDSGIDVTLIEARLRLTPTERMQQLQDAVTRSERARGNGNQLPTASMGAVRQQS